MCGYIRPSPETDVLVLDWIGEVKFVLGKFDPVQSLG